MNFFPNALRKVVVTLLGTDARVPDDVAELHWASTATPCASFAYHKWSKQAAH